MSKRLFLIDGNSFCYRAFYAIKVLSNSKGQPTNAVYGFIMMLKKIMESERPEYLGVTFDMKWPTFRHKKFEEYKIHRKPMPDALVSQLPLIKKTLSAYRIPVLEKEGFEADDILGTLAKKFAQKNLVVVLVTEDKDALQLVNSSVWVYHTHQEGLIYDSKKVREKFGVEPAKIPDLMALMGDASDNIPGVRGIGDKGATELVKEFGSVEELIERVDRIRNPRMRRAIQEHLDQMKLSKELALIECDVPIEISLDELRVHEPDKEMLFQIFQELEFRSLLRDLDVEPTEWKTKYRILTKDKEVEELVKTIQNCSAWSIELTSEVHGLAVCWKEAEACFVPRESWTSSLLKLLADSRAIKISHDFKEKIVSFYPLGIELEGLKFDTMLASYVLDPSRSRHELEDLALEYLRHPVHPDERSQQNLCEIADAVFRLYKKLEPLIREKDQLSLLQKIELPVVRILAQMQIHGVVVDVDVLKDLSKKMERELSRLTKDIYEMADCEFNINSPKQLAEVLFERLKLPIVKRTKTGVSTDVEVLEKLSSEHPLPRALLEYRELSKLTSTYVDVLPQLINPKTGRIHTSYNQAVTATGRLSSTNPNLQNIPIRTELGRQIRRAFVAPGREWRLLSADYSQIELRILAHLSKDEVLIRAFKEGRDIHTYTASLILKVPPEKITQDMRRIAKSVNFGIIYGMGAFGLSKDVGIDPGEARAFIDAYFERYPGVRSFLDRQIDQAKELGYVTTLFNRRRYVPEIQSSDNNIRAFGERVALNTPLQGTASDLMKLAMIRVDEALSKERESCAMILQVHDELVFEVRKERLQWLVPTVRDCMENVMKLEIPIRVDIKVGENWLEVEEVQ